MNRKSPRVFSRIRHALRQAADLKKAAFFPRFFKTGKGEYGEGDRFLGVTVPDQRKIAKQFCNAPRADLVRLLAGPYHEERLTALLILIEQYRRGGPAEQSKVVALYLRHLDRVNNWDLVDLSAPLILGDYLVPRSRSRLYQLVRSKNLWRRRIALLSTFAFIRHNDFADTLLLCEILLCDTQDLIHKAVGWMLREVGKRDRPELKRFLDDHAPSMPRTSLRYAIEHFSSADRKRLLLVTR